MNSVQLVGNIIALKDNNNFTTNICMVVGVRRDKINVFVTPYFRAYLFTENNIGRKVEVLGRLTTSKKRFMDGTSTNVSVVVADRICIYQKNGKPITTRVGEPMKKVYETVYQP